MWNKRELKNDKGMKDYQKWSRHFEKKSRNVMLKLEKQYLGYNNKIGTFEERNREWGDRAEEMQSGKERWDGTHGRD